MKAAIRGKIHTYLAAIGSEDGSDAMIAAMEAVGTKFSIKEYTSTGVHEKYLIFAKGGVDFLLLDGIVDTVFFHLRDSEKYAAYAHVEALVDGLAPGMPRAEVIDLLGPARQDREHFLLYPAGDAFVNIQLDDERISAIDAQRFDLLAQAEAEQAESVPTTEPKPLTGEILQPIDAASSTYGDPVMLDLLEPLDPPQALDHGGTHVTAAIRGEILTYLEAIGSEDGSDEMIAAMEAVGTRFILDEYTSAGTREKYLCFEKGGVEFLLHDGVVETVDFYLRDNKEYTAYAHPNALVEGVSLGTTRAEVIALLGTPRQNRERFLLYAVGSAFVHFQIRDERVTRIAAMRADLVAEEEAADAAAAAPALAAEPKPITGEISQLINAAGSAYGDPVMLDLVELLGPRLDSHDIDAADGGGKLLVFASGGVDLQYRDGVLLAVLVHVHEDERRPYPRLGTLVDGLSFPATREDVHAALGAPNDSRSHLDLYSENGTHVMFNYNGGSLATISIVHVPDDA